MSTRPTQIDAKEDATLVVRGTFKDDEDVAVPAADLFTARFWLHDPGGNVINARSDIDILNAGPGVVGSDGKLVLTLAPEDQPIVDTTLDAEVHILTIEWTWNGGASKSHEEIHVVVRNSKHVPTV